jgi:UDP-glucose 4-epimerase
MKVLVTGGAGFIGSHVVEKLLEQSIPLVIIDNFSTGRQTRPPKDVVFYKEDIRADLSPVFARHQFTHVIHLAAQTSVGESMKNPRHDGDVNIIGLINILQHCAAHGLKRFVFTSSAAVYGHAGLLPIQENSPLMPASFYGLSKQSGESYIRQFSALYGFAYMNLRLANVYGSRQGDTGEGGVVSIFQRHIQKGESVEILGTGDQTRDFIYCGDVARAIILALTSETKNCTLNISTKQEISINRLLQEFSGLTGGPVPFIRRAPRPGDILHSCLDNEKAWRVLGWKPNYTLTMGLSKLSQC